MVDGMSTLKETKENSERGRLGFTNFLDLTLLAGMPSREETKSEIDSGEVKGWHLPCNHSGSR